MGRRQALGWLGAVVCSVALIVAGGFILSSVAVHRYLQESDSALHRGEAEDTGTTPPAAEVASINRVVTAITQMPGVATASCGVETPGGTAPDPAPAALPTATPTATPTVLPPVTPTAAGSSTGGFSYQLSVIMDPSATAAEATDVVFNLTKQLQNSHVDLELSAPQGGGHAEAVIDYHDAFDAPVSRATVAAVSQAVSVATAVPGVASVHMTVPYTWNLSAGDLQVEFTSDSGHQPAAALKTALKRTALAGVDWEATR